MSKQKRTEGIRHAVVPLLIADGGSTKCEWLLASESGIRRFETRGCNPAILTDREIVECWRDAFATAGVAALSPVVRYYGAGCIGGSQSDTMARALACLSGNADIEVSSDMLGAARSTLKHGSGVACILGTGANSCAYNGRTITANIRPLGYILGDEGSGADIGRHIVADALKGLLDNSTTEAFYAFAQTGYNEIIENIYRKPGANAYLARYAIFASQNITNEAIADIVYRRLTLFLERNVLLYDHTLLDCGLSFIGGIAKEFKSLLREACRQKGLEIKTICERPIDGMFAYHSERK